MGCLPVFKSLFTHRNSTAGGRYSSRRSKTALGSNLSSTTAKRASSIPLQSYVDTHNARGQNTERKPRSDSEENMMGKYDEEVAVMGSRYIRVQTDFVSWFSITFCIIATIFLPGENKIKERKHLLILLTVSLLNLFCSIIRAYDPRNITIPWTLSEVPRRNEWRFRLWEGVEILDPKACLHRKGVSDKRERCKLEM